jgi:endonuclease/exonuclease/phosphatase (EEP) superfamily protein YafD
MRILTWFISILSVIVTALPIIRVPYWWVRIFDFPRFQIAILCLISLILLARFAKQGVARIVLIGLVAAAFLYQLYFIIPYTPLYSTQAKNYSGQKNQASFTILAANIKMDNEEVEEFLTLVSEYNPDILVITEPNAWWDEQTVSLAKEYPYSIKVPLENTYGMILYSRLELKNEEINYLAEENIPSFVAKVILPDKQDFDLFTLHPTPPKPGTPTYDRDTEILIVGRRIKTTDRPSVVVGDLNDVGWSHTSRLFQRYSQLLDPRKGRGFYNTYNVFIPLFRYPLDHFFFSEDFGFIRLEKLRAIGSDHYPVLLELNLDKSRSNQNNIPEPDPDDPAEVEQKIRQEK